jgi:hypothetical protein
MGCICSISRQILADINIKRDLEINNNANMNNLLAQNKNPNQNNKNIIIGAKMPEINNINQDKLKQPKKEENEKEMKNNNNNNILEKKDEKDEKKESEKNSKNDTEKKEIKKEENVKKEKKEKIEKKEKKEKIEKKEKKEEEENEYLTKNNYNLRVFELINQIRINPSEYSQTVLDNINNIIIENHKIINKETGIEENKQEIVFKKKVKVNLYKGEESFREAVNALNRTPSMQKLKFNKDIVIPLPNNEQDIINSDFIKSKANEIRQFSNINIYFKEYIKNPEVAVLLMIVDDTEIMSGKKRECLLNPHLKYIGIDSKFIGKNFIAHFSFSK